MKTISSIGTLARSGFHPHFAWEFDWRASSGKKARHLDVSRKFLLLWIKIINEQCIGAKISKHWLQNEAMHWLQNEAMHWLQNEAMHWLQNEAIRAQVFGTKR